MNNKISDTKRKNKVVRAWVSRHINDHYVQSAHKDGYRSRAAYKLLEADKIFELFKNVQCVIDLGCAPGSWLQVAKHKVGSNGVVIGVDLLEVEPVRDVVAIQGDFTADDTLAQLVQVIDGRVVDLVLSDMSPNLSGVKMVDQARLGYLVEIVLLFAADHLKSGGDCVIKVFHGGEFDRLVKLARKAFTRVEIYKPEASRDESSEVYLVCKSLL